MPGHNGAASIVDVVIVVAVTVALDEGNKERYCMFTCTLLFLVYKDKSSNLVKLVWSTIVLRAVEMFTPVYKTVNVSAFTIICILAQTDNGMLLLLSKSALITFWTCLFDVCSLLRAYYF